MHPRLRLLAGLVAAALLMIVGATAEAATKRVALVIGNSAYEHVPALANPRNDAADMAGKLEGLGFEVVRGEDLDLMAMRATIRSFVGKLDGAEVSLFFYAGHGLQVNGTNYMAPVDARLGTYDDLDFEVVPMELVLSAMERYTKTNLIFLDACRDNPLAENLARSMGTRSGSVGRGLARLGAGVGTLISLATQPGNVALDGEGRNSPFTTALLKHLGTPGQDISRDLILVRREVLDATGGRQVPWDHSSLTGEVVLKEAPKAEPAPEVKAPEVKAPEPAKPDNSVELAYWQTIKDTNEKGFFEAYLQQFPDGAFANLARLKIAQIEAGLVAPSQSESEGDAAQIAYWNSVKDAGSLAYFEAYLARWPKGTFAEIARIRIDEMKARQSLEQAARSTETKAAEEREKHLQEQIARLEAARKALEAEEAKRSVAQQNEVAALDPKREPAEATPQLTGLELARAVQAELVRIGCLGGGVDGEWGRGSERALKDYAGRQGIALANLLPDNEVLRRLKATAVRVCPLVCGKGMEERGGRCVKSKQEASLPKAEEKPKATSSLPGQSAKAEPGVGGRTCRSCQSSDAYRRGMGFTRTCLTELEWTQNQRFLECK